MKIEILYFEGCPNHRPAVDRVHEVLRKERIAATVSEVNISDASAAREAGFPGSPTIRVNGLDIDPAARPARFCGLMCRTYLVNGQMQGLPAHEVLRDAILEANRGSE